MSKRAGGSVILITGVMAAGKSSVAQLVAEQLNPSIHLRGDVFRKMIVNGREDMSAQPTALAMEQLLLRYRAAAATARLYAEVGFQVVYQDVIIGPVLQDVVALYADVRLQVFVLNPELNVVAMREANREKNGYGQVSVEALNATLLQTPAIGTWIDSSHQSALETAQDVLKRLD